MFYFYTALGTCILPLGALIGSMLGGIFVLSYNLFAINYLVKIWIKTYNIDQ